MRMPSTNCLLNQLVTPNEVAKKLGINFQTALMHLTVTRKEGATRIREGSTYSGGKGLRITDMLDEIKRIADKYFKPYEIKRGEKGKGRYWVDIITADLSLGTLDSARARYP
jgi:predicted transcriptional regulator